MQGLEVNIDRVLKDAVDMGATDVHITPNTEPRCRVHGELTAIKGYAQLSVAQVDTLLKPLLDAYDRKQLGSVGQVDQAYEIKSDGLITRFRVNLYRQKGAISGVFRVLPSKIRDYDSLNLPPVVFDVTTLRRGMVLVTGVTGSGKSTTLASILDIINNEYSKHIITLEEPIEYIHSHNKSIVSQREIGLDTVSFAEGLRSALREDPDVILVGEMRDVETMETALQAAETGHLVFSTLHTLGAVETVNRIINAFPESRHLQLRSQLATVLSCVISQQLLPKKDKSGYAVAVELLFLTDMARQYILNNDVMGLNLYLRSDEARKQGMVSMDDSIVRLYSKGVISRSTALSYAVDRKGMEDRLC